LLAIRTVVDESVTLSSALKDSPLVLSSGETVKLNRYLSAPLTVLSICNAGDFDSARFNADIAELSALYTDRHVNFLVAMSQGLLVQDISKLLQSPTLVMPQILLVAKDGLVVKRLNGFSKFGKADLSKAIDDCLKAQTSPHPKLPASNP
jgi:hypothetical protein